MSMKSRRSFPYLLRASVLCGLALALPSFGMQATPNEGAWLGVYIQDLTPQLRHHFPAGAEGGVLVSGVIAGSPAEAAGLQAGDILLELDGARLHSSEHLRQSISRKRPDTDADVRVLRGPESLAFTVRVGPRPASVGRRVQDSERREPRDLPWSRWFILGHEGGLGARMAEINSDLAPYFPGTGDGGVLVLEVCDGSPADRAGLRPGDVLVAVNEVPVGDLGDLRHELRISDEGTARLGLVRRGERISTTIELRSAPECWKSPQRSFFRLRPDTPSARPWPRPDSDRGQGNEPMPDVLRSVPEALERFWNDEGGRLGEQLQREMKDLRGHSERLEAGLQQLREELERLREAAPVLSAPPQAGEPEAGAEQP
jgi:membrane-associated protease RseP (regulator of RpoE activity)